MSLHNRADREELQRRLENEDFGRITISFYRYVRIVDPDALRNDLFIRWEQLNCLGRIYLAGEGINAQMSVPEHNADLFFSDLDTIPEFKDMPVKQALEDGKSFIKLTIKVKKKIVADGLDDNAYDVTDVGNHLSALEFHELIDDPDTVVVDMRNHYESEIGHFKGAILPQSNTFREELELVKEELRPFSDRKLLLYCTGGIRCEKASAYLKHYGFKDVNQLHGGIIEYTHQVKSQGLQSKFVGKNFVFDNRLGERVNETIISTCHQCGKPCDSHTNCANQACHILFIQCDECRNKYEGCCSESCHEVYNDEQKLKIFRDKHPFTGKRWMKKPGMENLKIVHSPF